MKGSSLKKNLLSFLIITLGSAVFSFGFVWFFQPNDIASGGLTGLAQVSGRDNLEFEEKAKLDATPTIPVTAPLMAVNVP